MNGCGIDLASPNTAMNIVVRKILGHLRNPDGGYTVFVDAELGDTILGSLRLTLPAGHQPLEIFRLIVNASEELPEQLLPSELTL
jgi:hypothetical protein